MALDRRRILLHRNQFFFVTTPKTHMKKSLRAATTLLILAGCTPAPPQPTVPESNSPEIQATTGQTITPDSSGVEPTVSTVNEIELLDSTLATATSENKRVLVHLGAKW